MKNFNFIKSLIFLGALLTSNMSSAQFELKVSDVFTSISNTQIGLPFTSALPIHPGVEAGCVFLKKTKERSEQAVSVDIGYLHHDLLVYAPHIKFNYSFQYNIKQTIGLKMYAGLGYRHFFYPGDAYVFNESTGFYEKSITHQGFIASQVGIGITYIKSEKFKPFVKYDVNLGNLNLLTIFAGLHLGVSMAL